MIPGHLGTQGSAAGGGGGGGMYSIWLVFGLVAGQTLHMAIAGQQDM